MARTRPAGRAATAAQAVEISFLESLRRRLPDNLTLLRPLADMYTEVGRFEDGYALDRLLVAHEPEDSGAWYNLACSQALLGKPLEALDSLASAVQTGYDDPDWMRKDPDLESLRDLPEFAALVRSIASQS